MIIQTSNVIQKCQKRDNQSVSIKAPTSHLIALLTVRVLGIVTIPSSSPPLFPPSFTDSLRICHGPHNASRFEIPQHSNKYSRASTSGFGLTALRGAIHSIDQDKQFIPCSRQPESIVSATAYCTSPHMKPGSPQNATRLHTRFRISPACHFWCFHPNNNLSNRSTALHPKTNIKELLGPCFLPDQVPLSIHLRFRFRSLKHSSPRQNAIP